MAFDTRKMLFPSQIKARQEAEERRKKQKPVNIGLLFAAMAGITAGMNMEQPRRRSPPKSLDDLNTY